jgi:hypothetical protein
LGEPAGESPETRYSQFFVDKTKRQYILFLLTLTLVLRGQNNLQLDGIGPFKNGNEYAGGTIVFSAIDATFTTFNIIRLIKTGNHRSNATFGFLFGTAQTVYGLLNVKSGEKNANVLTTINVGLGLTTIISSGLRFLKRRVPKENKVTFNFFCVPQVDNYSGTLCFAVIGRLK